MPAANGTAGFDWGLVALGESSTSATAGQTVRFTATVTSPFLRLKRNNLFVKGTPSVEFHGDIFHPDDLVIYKQRVGAFSDNHLGLILRSAESSTSFFSASRGAGLFSPR